ncbi:MAG: crotonase/enoyl-CoA hydratase family protein [Hydrogenophilaceae bacterium]|jgi:enoyl-CoA hydratase/carnithine racemase|nr:crotonase/enoyl-CoA hydratase family protein [Hydrogenophilaceae bacterium]
MSKPFVVAEKDGRIVTVTLNRPETRNAIAEHVDCEALIAALRDANADPEVSVLILTGAGSAFSAGGNIQSMRDRNGIGPLATPADTRANYRRGVQQIPRALADLEIATIAAVNGHAVGLGLDLAALCDLRVAAADAKFAASFIKLGIAPGDGGAWILQRVLGYARAAELILTGDPITAAEAAAIGLVNKVVPADEVMREARALAARIAVNPPRSVRLSKRLLREAQHARLSDVLELSAAFQALAHETADHKEAVDAFIEKRAPVFTGA